MFPVRVEEFAPTGAGRRRAAAYRADWQIERLGHALVREFLLPEEQERLSLAVRRRLDRVGHVRERQVRVERRGAGTPPPSVRWRATADPRHAAASVAGWRRSSRPRLRACARRVEDLALLERDPE
jgi:hypothetical protein